MALLTLQDASGGAAVTFSAAAAGGDTMPGGTEGANWALGVVLLVQNADTVAHTVTVEGHPAVNVPATSGRAVIPVNGGVYFGAIKTITYDAATSVTVAAVRLSPAG